MEKKIDLIKGSESFKLTVTEELEKKIRFYCEKLPHNEYSGTLFYKIEGSFEGKDLHVIAKDFYIQDVGSSTFTEFQNDETLAGYMVEHQLWDCYQGLMHSHNTMSTFFSGTDTSTLLSEGKDANHFVSLIINNAGKYTAAITRHITKTFDGNMVVKYPSFNNTEVVASAVPVKVENESIEYFMLDIDIEKYEMPKSEMQIRLDELLKSKQSYVNHTFTGLKAPATQTTGSPLSPWIPKAKEPVQGELFHKQFEEKKKESTFIPAEEINEAKSDNADDGLIEDHLPKEMLNSHVAQLISGNLFAGNNPHFNLETWVNNMEAAYNKRFYDDTTKEVNFDSYKYWMDCLIDCLEEECHGTELELAGAEYATTVWASELIDKFSGLFRGDKNNPYVDYIIESLERYGY